MPQTQGRTNKDGRWVPTPGPAAGGAAELASSARAVATAAGPAFGISDEHRLFGTLNVTNINGGTVTAGLEVTYDGTNWENVGNWPTKSANGTHRKGFGVRGATQARWVWTVATAAVTFAVQNITG